MRPLVGEVLAVEDAPVVVMLSVASLKLPRSSTPRWMTTTTLLPPRTLQARPMALSPAPQPSLLRPPTLVRTLGWRMRLCERACYDSVLPRVARVKVVEACSACEDLIEGWINSWNDHQMTGLSWVSSCYFF